jgi:methyl-accepting chemotaxis protein
MTEIPTWWLVLSGVFFLMNTLLFLAAIVVAVYLIRLIKESGPKIAALEKSIQELLVKIQAVATRVEEVATSVRETVDNVAGKATRVAGSAEMVASSASRQFDKVSPIVTGVLTSIKIFRAIQSMRSSRSAKKAKEAKKKSGLAVFRR